MYLFKTDGSECRLITDPSNPAPAGFVPGGDLEPDAVREVAYRAGIDEPSNPATLSTLCEQARLGYADGHKWFDGPIEWDDEDDSGESPHPPENADEGEASDGEADEDAADLAADVASQLDTMSKAELAETYEGLFGAQPDGRWTKATLIEKIDELLGA